MEHQIEQEFCTEMKDQAEQESDMEQEEGGRPVDDDEEADTQRLGHWEPPDYFLG
jgi:hypothetical protein